MNKLVKIILSNTRDVRIMIRKNLALYTHAEILDLHNFWKSTSSYNMIFNCQESLIGDIDICAYYSDYNDAHYRYKFYELNRDLPLFEHTIKNGITDVYNLCCTSYDITIEITDIDRIDNDTEILKFYYYISKNEKSTDLNKNIVITFLLCMLHYKNKNRECIYNLNKYISFEICCLILNARSFYQFRRKIIELNRDDNNQKHECDISWENILFKYF